MPDERHDPFPIFPGRYGDAEGATGRETWVEGTYGERAWVPEDAPIGRQEFIGLAATGRRILIIFAFLSASVLVLFGRVSFLVAREGEFRALAEGNRLRTVSVSTPRGIIYDRNGAQLVDNVPDLKLAIAPADLPDAPDARHAAIVRIAAAIGTDPDELKSAIAQFDARSNEPAVIADHLSRDQAIAVTIAGAELAGAEILDGTHRRYPLTNTLTSLSHLLGYMGAVGRAELSAQGSGYITTDSVGRSGLERSYEATLRGVPGSRKVEVDALGNEVRVVEERVGEPGRNLTLAIDSELTVVAEDALSRAFARSRASRGAVVVEDVRNGELLALVSLPAFVNNRFSEGISAAEYRALVENPDHPLFPRAISGTYPSGSTVKLVVAAAALAERIVTPATTVHSTGGILYADRWWFPDWRAGGHGITNLRRAISWSVNTYFYLVGGGFESFEGLGIERLVHWLGRFGVGEPLGIDLPGGVAGLLPTPEWKQSVKGEEWYIGDTYHLAIGQGDLLVTPLHVAAWTVAVANGGTVWKPHVVRAISGPTGEDSVPVAPVALREEIMPAGMLASVRAGMRDAVTEGSATPAAAPGIAVAGKTGTAQWNANRRTHAWFTGYAPYEDPAIAVTVLVEEGGEGSSVAAPVAAEIFGWWAAHRSSSTADLP